MRKYCLVNELKPEHVKDYEEIHETAHLTHWKTQLDALKEAGATDCIVYVYKNLSILFYECEEINESFKKLGTIEANNEWQSVVAQWFANTPKFDGSEETVSIKKIFDLNQQLDGELNQF